MIDLDELERLCREATPGPWKNDPLRGMHITYNGLGGLLVATVAVNTYEDQGKHNVSLIVTLRNAAPELIAMARRYQWLREHTVATGLSRWVHPHQFLDAAIDAAMQEQKP